MFNVVNPHYCVGRGGKVIILLENQAVAVQGQLLVLGIAIC